MFENILVFVDKYKWCLLFLVFGVLIAYALGKRSAQESAPSQEVINKIETDNKNKTVSGGNNNKPNREFFNGSAKKKSSSKKKKIRTKVVTSPPKSRTSVSSSSDTESCLSAPDDFVNKHVIKEKRYTSPTKQVLKPVKVVYKKKSRSPNKVAVSKKVKKEVCPDLSRYVPKVEVIDKYMLKSQCKPKKIDHTKYVSRDVLENNYVHKDEYNQLEDDYRLMNDTNVELRKRLDQQQKRQREQRLLLQKQQKKISKNKKVISARISNIKKKVSSKKNRVGDKNLVAQQDLLDKNKMEITDNFAKVNDPFTICNLKTCNVNGYPNGLITLNN